MFASQAVQARFMGQVPLATTNPQPLSRPVDVDSFELADSNVASQFASAATVRSSLFASALTLGFLDVEPTWSSGGGSNSGIGLVTLTVLVAALTGLKVYATRRGYHWTRAAFTNEGRFLNESLRPDAEFVSVKDKMSWKYRAAFANALPLVFNRRGELRLFTYDELASKLLSADQKYPDEKVVQRNGHRIEIKNEGNDDDRKSYVNISREYKGKLYDVFYKFDHQGKRTYYVLRGLGSMLDSDGFSSFRG